LHSKWRVRKGRALRHCGDAFSASSMKSVLDIAHPTAPLPFRHRPDACARPRDQRGHPRFIRNG
jgi:hypothetical protein